MQEPLIRKDEVHRFTESNRTIYVVRKPYCEESPHSISMLKSGALEVICCHCKMDENQIRKDVKSFLNKK